MSDLLPASVVEKQEWAGHRTKRKKTRVPREIAFETKPQFAAIRVWAMRHRKQGPPDLVDRPSLDGDKSGNQVLLLRQH